MNQCSECKYVFAINASRLPAEEVPATREHEEIALYECRKALPLVYAYRENKKLSGWPDVKPDDWCGEFEKKPEAPSTSLNVEFSY